MTAAEEYFAGRATSRAPGAQGSFWRLDDQVPLEPVPGIVLRVVPGANLLLSHVTIEPHREAAVHSHDEEQLGLIASGSCEFEMDGEVRRLGPGDVYLAPPGVPHGLRTGDEPCVVIDMFSPPRAALLDLLGPAAPAGEGA